MLYAALLTVVGFALLTVGLLLGASVGRWLVVRALGVRGVPFPFGAGARWTWTSASIVPQALVFLGSLAGMYTVPASVVAAGLWATGQDRADEQSMRIVVEPDGPAAVAGLHDGDRVDAVDGDPVPTWSALRGAIARHPREPVDVLVTRDAHELHLTVTPDRSGLIRVKMPTVHETVGLGEALRTGAVSPALFLYETARGALDTLAGSRHETLSGPVGIVKETREQTGHGRAVVFFGVVGAYLLPFLAFAAPFFAPGRRRRR